LSGGDHSENDRALLSDVLADQRINFIHDSRILGAHGGSNDAY
jgi:hypothetical protein